jgi:hypothetical protein
LKTPQQLLQSLENAALLLVLNYGQLPSRFTITAMSPSATLLLELLGAPPDSNLLIDLNDSNVLHQLHYDPTSKLCLQPLRNIAWWQSKRVLPIVLKGNDVTSASP